MKRFVIICLAASVFAVWAWVLPAHSAESSTIRQEMADLASKEDMSQPKELSVYGEVQSVDTAANSLSVQYYDYDSDQEKTAEITLDKNTRIENATGIDKIAKGDWIDIVYAVKDAKNIAISAVVEKEEPEDMVDATDMPVEE
jgi:hypothetical protein